MNHYTFLLFGNNLGNTLALVISFMSANLTANYFTKGVAGLKDKCSANFRLQPVWDEFA